MPATIDQAKLRDYVDRMGERVLFATLSGAHLYGFPDENSDYDIRGVHVAHIRDVLGFRGGCPETIEHVDGVDRPEELDLVSHEVGKFCRLLCKPNGNMLEQLYSPHVIVTSPEHETLKELAQDVLCKKLARHYEGFWLQQQARYSDKPWKKLRQLLYGYRVLLTGIHLMRSGTVQANIIELSPHANADRDHVVWVPPLLDAKVRGLNEVPRRLAWNAVGEQENLARTLHEVAFESHLPDDPDPKRINEFLVELRLKDAREEA